MEATLFGSAADPGSRGPVALRPRIAPGLPFREVVSQSICIPNSTREADIAAGRPPQTSAEISARTIPLIRWGAGSISEGWSRAGRGEILSSIPGISGEDRRCFRKVEGTSEGPRSTPLESTRELRATGGARKPVRHAREGMNAHGVPYGPTAGDGRPAPDPSADQLAGASSHRAGDLRRRAGGHTDRHRGPDLYRWIGVPVERQRGARPGGACRGRRTADETPGIQPALHEPVPRARDLARREAGRDH